MRDFNISIDNQGVPFTSLNGGNSFFNNIWLSLNIPLGSWWVDPSFGLAQRPRRKLTSLTMRQIEDDHNQALKWLLDSGRATLINLLVVAVDVPNRIRVIVTATPAEGDQVTYEKFVEVI
ncbi:MAG: phage GP46 family protein [Geobacteraceae bacterium]|nr:phage GP46 family protein [Geobacteraceae bacterium]